MKVDYTLNLKQILNLFQESGEYNMSIDDLSILLDELKGYINDYKNIKEENKNLKIYLSEKESIISEKNSKIAELQEQADLKLNEVKTIVDELKGLIANV